MIFSSQDSGGANKAQTDTRGGQLPHLSEMFLDACRMLARLIMLRLFPSPLPEPKFWLKPRSAPPADIEERLKPLSCSLDRPELGMGSTSGCRTLSPDTSIFAEVGVEEDQSGGRDTTKN